MNYTKYNKEYYEANKERYKAKSKAYYEEHKEQQKAQKKAWYEANKDKVKAYQKANKVQYKAYQKEYQKAYRQSHKEEAKAYKKSDVNSLGQTKCSIRLKSQRILKRMNLHIPGYEIHHCFGYEDASKFIYISKSLHLKIHKYLREHIIDSSTDHWMHIRELVNDSDEFVYIKC